MKFVVLFALVLLGSHSLIAEASTAARIAGQSHGNPWRFWLEKITGPKRKNSAHDSEEDSMRYDQLPMEVSSTLSPAIEKMVKGVERQKKKRKHHHRNDHDSMANSAFVDSFERSGKDEDPASKLAGRLLYG